METALKTGFLLVWFSINIICPERFGSRGSDGISNERQHGLPTTYLLLFSQRWQLIVVQLQCYCKYVKWIYWTIGLQESHILIYIYIMLHTYIYICVCVHIYTYVGSTLATRGPRRGLLCHLRPWMCLRMSALSVHEVICNASTLV